MSVLTYRCTTWTLTKCIDKKVDGDYTKMLCAVSNKSRKQHLNGNLPPISQTIEERQSRHDGHCGRSKEELISDVLIWTPTHRHTSVGQPARTYINQLCVESWCSLEDLLGVVYDKDGERERERERVRECQGTSSYQHVLMMMMMMSVFL